MPVILPVSVRSEWLNLNNNVDEVIQAALLDMKHWTALISQDLLCIEKLL